MIRFGLGHYLHLKSDQSVYLLKIYDGKNHYQKKRDLLDGLSPDFTSC